MMEQLLQQQADASHKERLRLALGRLTSDNGMVESFDRVNRGRFRKNMREFVANVKAFLKTK